MDVHARALAHSKARASKAGRPTGSVSQANHQWAWNVSNHSPKRKSARARFLERARSVRWWSTHIFHQVWHGRSTFLLFYLYSIWSFLYFPLDLSHVIKRYIGSRLIHVSTEFWVLERSDFRIFYKHESKQYSNDLSNHLAINFITLALSDPSLGILFWCDFEEFRSWMAQKCISYKTLKTY